MIAPALFVWWLRPDRRATRVGEQSAVVWKRLSRSPRLASRSSVGIGMAPPKALVCPKPMSSIRNTITFGARGGAFTSHLEPRRRLRVARVELGRPRMVGLRDREQGPVHSGRLRLGGPDRRPAHRRGA